MAVVGRVRHVKGAIRAQGEPVGEVELRLVRGRIRGRCRGRVAVRVRTRARARVRTSTRSSS